MVGVVAFVLALGAHAARADRIVYCPSNLVKQDPIAQCTDTLSNPTLSDQDRADALYLRGWRYCDRRQYSEALADFDAAIKFMRSVDPDAGRKIFKTEESAFDYDIVRSYGDFYLGRSCALAGLERFPEALDAATTGENLFLSAKGKAHALEQRALVHVQMGDLEKAETLYRDALPMEVKLGENGMNVRYDLAVVLVGLDKPGSVAEILAPQDAMEDPFRKSALLLYVLGSLSPKQVQDVLAENRSRGLGDLIPDYFAGRLELNGLLAKPDGYSDVEQQDRLCVTNFFIGEWMVSKNRTEAITYFLA
jgi:tetratricopeptide (TPR) repeat protein